MNIANQLNTASAMHKSQANRIRNLMGETNSPPQGYHYMPGGKLMKNSNHNLGSSIPAAMGPFVGFTLIFGLLALAGVVDQVSSN